MHFVCISIIYRLLSLDSRFFTEFDPQSSGMILTSLLSPSFLTQHARIVHTLPSCLSAICCIASNAQLYDSVTASFCIEPRPYTAINIVPHERGPPVIRLSRRPWIWIIHAFARKEAYIRGRGKFGTKRSLRIVRAADAEHGVGVRFCIYFCKQHLSLHRANICVRSNNSRPCDDGQTLE